MLSYDQKMQVLQMILPQYQNAKCSLLYILFDVFGKLELQKAKHVSKGQDQTS